MGIAYFQKGVELEIDGQPFQLNRKIDDHLWQAEKTKTGQMKEFTMAELKKLLADGKLVFCKDKVVRDANSKLDSSNVIVMRTDISPAEWEKAKRRRSYVRAVEELPCTENLYKPAILKVWEKSGRLGRMPHWTTVARWVAKYRKHGKDAHALVEESHKKGKRGSDYSQEVVDIVNASIDRVYMTRERGTVAETHVHAMVQVDRRNKQLASTKQLKLPPRYLVQREIDSIPAFDRYVARYGQVAALRIFRSRTNHRITNHALETAEMDHTQLDIFVIDEDGVPMGRPWITICIDVHTRCILGIYIGFEPPSYLSVARCLKHAFLPKVDLQQQYPGIKNPWIAHGVMETLRVDNGMEFHGHAFEQACYSFGVEIEFMPRKKAWFKGTIERFNKTLNDSVCHGSPGTSFSNIFEKDDYDPEKHAVLTLPKLRLIIHKWIADCYHHAPHRGLEGIAPAVMWSKSIRDEDIPLPEDPARIDVMLGKPANCTLSHKGVEINNLFYNSHDLTELRRQYGDTLKVDVMVDESNVGHLYVMLPDGIGYVEVPAVNSDYAAGISLWQHKLFRRHAKLHDRTDDARGWAHAKVEIMEIVQGEVNLKKGRKKAAVKKGRLIEADLHAKESVILAVPEDSPILTPMPRKKSPSRFTAIIENRPK